MSLVLTVAVSPDAAITAFEINYQALGAVFPAPVPLMISDASSENQLRWMIW